MKRFVKFWHITLFFLLFSTGLIWAVCPNIAGYNTIGASSPGALTGQAKADAVTFTQSGSVDTINLYISIAGNGQFQVALYDSNAGQPGNVLVTSSAKTSVTGWNVFSITPTNVTGGTQYFEAFEMQNASDASNYDSSAGWSRWSINTSFGTFPNGGSWSSTFTVTDSIYATECFIYGARPPGSVYFP